MRVLLPQASPPGSSLLSSLLRLLPTKIFDRALDRVFGENRTMDLHGRQREFFCDLAIFQALGLFERLPFDPLRRQGRRRDRRAAAEGLEASILDDPRVADLDLQAHNVTTSGRTDEPGAHAVVILVERSDVPRILVVLDHLVAVG